PTHAKNTNTREHDAGPAASSLSPLVAATVRSLVRRAGDHKTWSPTTYDSEYGPGRSPARTASAKREAEVEGHGGRELARVRAAVDLGGVGSRVAGGDGQVRIERRPDRVAGEEVGGEELRRLCPVAERVRLQLDAVAVRFDVVERDRHAVVEARVREDALALQPDVRVEQAVERRELEGRVVHPGARELVGIVGEAAARCLCRIQKWTRMAPQRSSRTSSSREAEFLPLFAGWGRA